MRIRTLGGMAVVAVAMSALAAGAQDKMGKPMEMGSKEKTYTGCVEAGAVAGAFTLGHATAEMAMGKEGKEGMKKDAMKKDAMDKDAMGKGAMDMAALSIPISSKKIDLRKHVGHKVSVTGREDGMHALTVSSLKMLASTCGM